MKFYIKQLVLGLAAFFVQKLIQGLCKCLFVYVLKIF